MEYIKIYFLKNDLKFAVSDWDDNEIGRSFVDWCWDRDLISSGYYECVHENELEERNIVRI